MPELPVASVLIDSGLPHLDRAFEYAVPAQLADAAQPGVRVRLRFAGQDRSGYVVARHPSADHDGPLSPLRTVVSPEPVLTPQILQLARDLAEAYAGSTGDVLRLAIPPRHARAEQALAQEPPQADPLPPFEPGTSLWGEYRSGLPFVRQLADGGAPAAVWGALPAAGESSRDWPIALAQAAAATAAGGRGSVLVAPDHRDVDRLDAALRSVLGPGRHVRLTADQGPQARYTAWLKALRGHVSVVIGTRAAAYAPVRDLGLIAVWDDGDDLHEEPRAPYVHARDVAANRARIEGAALLLGGYGRSVAAQSLTEAGVLHAITASRAQVRAAAPRVAVAGEEREQERDPAATSARLPTIAWRAAKAALENGPVLIQVPRRGYVPSLACQECRARAHCARCHGPLTVRSRQEAAVCGWCAAPARDWQCPTCGGTRLRSLVVGARRTAEELGRALPGFPVLTSGAGSILATVPARAALIIATPGAEPVADGGYAAALLLDAWALIDRPALDAAPEALRRWLAAAALVRPAADGGSVIVTGVANGPTIPAVEALVRWDPARLAASELAERRLLRLPPAEVYADAVGPRRAVQALADRSDVPAGVVTFGPVPVPVPVPVPGGRTGDPGEGEATAYRLLWRAAPQDAPGLAAAMRAARAERSARKDPDAVRIRMGVSDPG